MLLFVSFRIWSNKLSASGAFGSSVGGLLSAGATAPAAFAVGFDGSGTEAALTSSDFCETGAGVDAAQPISQCLLRAEQPRRALRVEASLFRFVNNGEKEKPQKEGQRVQIEEEGRG